MRKDVHYRAKLLFLFMLVVLILVGLFIQKAHSSEHLVCTTNLSMINGEVTDSKVTFLVDPEAKKLAILDEWGRMTIMGDMRKGPGNIIHIVSKEDPISYVFTLYTDTGEYMHRFTNTAQALSGVYIGRCTEAHRHDA